MTRTLSNALALAAFGMSVLLAFIIVVSLVNVCVILYGRRFHTLRQRRTEGKMITVQPRIDRNPDCRPPKSG